MLSWWAGGRARYDLNTGRSSVEAVDSGWTKEMWTTFARNSVDRRLDVDVAFNPRCLVVSSMFHAHARGTGYEGFGVAVRQ